MLGAFAAIFGGITLDDVEKAIRLNMPEKLHSKNIAAVKAAAEEVRQ